MCAVARRRCVVLLLLAGIAWASRPAWSSPSPATEPVSSDQLTLVRSELALPEHRLTLLTLGDSPLDLPATTQPIAAASHPPAAEPQSIYDPLPPALWSGLSLLALAGAILSFRRLRSQLR